MLEFVREGDQVIVHSMDRLARNLDDLRKIVKGLTGRGVKVQFVKESLIFTGDDSPMSNLLLSLLGAVAEFERALIKERQREGIAVAKKNGAYKGRKRLLDPGQVEALKKRVKSGRAWPWNSASRGKPFTSTCGPDIFSDLPTKLHRRD